MLVNLNFNLYLLFEKIVVRKNDGLHKLNRAEIPGQWLWFVVDWKRKFNNSRHNAQIYFGLDCFYTSRYWMDSSVCLFQHMFLHILWGSLSLDSQQCYKQTKNNNVILINVKRFIIACIWSVSEVYYLPFVHFSKISGENLCTIMIRKYCNHHSSDVKSL